MTRFVLVRSAAEMRLSAAAAAARGTALHVVSAPAAGLHAGALWWQALVAEGAASGATVAAAVLDCADCPGRAMGALRAGLRDVLFDGTGPAAAALESLAAECGAKLWRKRPPALDLAAERRPDEALARWLDGPPPGP